jgi:PAS domain S-box-containing protein
MRARIAARASASVDRMRAAGAPRSMTLRQTKDVSLPPELEAFIAERIGSGEYVDASDMMRAALEALRDGEATVKRAPAPGTWPFDGGECGALIRSRDWSLTPLGPIRGWSLELRATVANIVNSPVAKVLMWGPSHVMLYNDAYALIAGPNHPKALGGAVPEIWPEIWDWNRRMLEAGFRGELLSFRDQPMTLRRDGRDDTFVFDLFYTPVYEADGSVGGVMCTVVDNSVRVAIDRQLVASHRRFRTAMDAVHGILWTNDASGRMAGEQPGWAALTGQSYDDYQGYGWAAAVHPEDSAATVAAWEKALAAKSMFVHEHRVRRADGEWRTFAIRALPVLDPQGEIEEWVGVHTDISHQRAAERALREHADALTRQVAHRERAEEQLRHLNECLEARVVAEIDQRRRAESKLAQSQKMETIGKLTGGVAHDFNNLLQVVSGNLQLLAKDIAGNERAERRVSNAMAGVSRGAKLAQQLLAFGRRQPLEPKVVNVGRLVNGMDDMMRRTIGEAIEIETVFAGGLWNTFIDPVQIETAVLNLAINARDAMAGRGKLTIELANAFLDDDYARSHEEVTPGRYVMLAVTDTGCGMSPELVEKVFEPFFSTKAEGKGSGLGLSMVYGFVKQSGGHVKIYSEPGHGTTIRLYLPRAVQAEDVEVSLSSGPVMGGSETVLIVEDDPEVRETVIAIVSDLGYRVLQAVDATSALSVIESGVPIDLLFTDVVMPGTLKSPELARMARERLPGVAVLFTSGYTENSIVHGGKLDEGVELLSKPYTREQLARKFRHVLANRQQRAGPEASAAERPAQAEPSTPALGSLTVLLVEDDELIRINTAEMLQRAGYVVVEARSAEEAMAALRTAPVDVLVTDLNLPGASGVALAAEARTLRPSAAVVYATGDATAVRDEPGASVLAKPYDARALLKVVEAALRVVGRVAEPERDHPAGQTKPEPA